MNDVVEFAFDGDDSSLHHRRSRDDGEDDGDGDANEVDVSIAAD